MSLQLRRDGKLVQVDCTDIVVPLHYQRIICAGVERDCGRHLCPVPLSIKATSTGKA